MSKEKSKKAEDIEAKTEAKAQAKIKAEAQAKAKIEIEGLEKRIYALAHGPLIDATYALSNVWLRVASGLELYSIKLVEQAKAEGLPGAKAEKNAKRNLEEFIKRTFDQNDRGNGIKNLQKQIDAYRWLKPVLDAFWLQKNFDIDIEKSLKVNGYLKVLSYLRKTTVYDLSREFSSEEAKTLFKGLNVKRESLSTEHASEGFIFTALNAEAKAKAEAARIKREAAAQAKAAAEGKDPDKGKRGHKDQTSESQGEVITVSGLPSTQIKHRGQLHKVLREYFQGTAQYLTFLKRSKIEDLIDPALVGESLARIKAVVDSAEELILNMDVSLKRNGYFCDMLDQYKVKSISQKAAEAAVKVASNG